jgi:hypothetical protein
MATVMSKALAKASSLKPEIRLAQAVSEFEASLTQEQKNYVSHAEIAVGFDGTYSDRCDAADGRS